MLDRLRRGLTENRVDTNPAHHDLRLRGRTYAIPFERVWNACLELAGGELPRWWVARADDQRGVIDARQKSLVFRWVDDVRIEVGLDGNAQTRVDVSSRSRKGRGDLGANARRVGRFLRALDRKLDAGPAQILDPTLTLRWTASSESVTGSPV